MVGPAVTVAQSIQDLCGCRWIGSTAHFYRYFLTDKNVTLFRGNVNDFLCKIRAFFAQCTIAPAIFAVLRSFRGRFNVKVPCIFAHSRFPSIITTSRAGGFLSTKKGASPKGSTQNASKSLAEFVARRRRTDQNHVLRRRVRRRTYLSDCKCANRPPTADDECAQQTATLLLEKPERDFPTV